MLGYEDDGRLTSAAAGAAITAPAMSRSATRKATSPIVGRADDVFKAADYRISPFELESAADRA